jgi:WD40 repeat protein
MTKVWDVKSGAEIAVYEQYCGRSVAVSPDDQWVVVGGDQPMKVWCLQTGEVRAVLDGHTNSILTVAFSTNGQRIVSASWDGTARVWDAADGQELMVLRLEREPAFRLLGPIGINTAAFSSDDARIVTGDNDHMLRLWDAVTGQESLSIDLGKAVYAATFSPDGQMVFTSGAFQTARMLDAKNGRKRYAIRVFDQPTGYVGCAGFSPNDQRLFTGDAHGTVKLWDAATGQQEAALSVGTGDVEAVCFYPDGEQFAVLCNGTVNIWSRRRPEYWWGIAWLPEFWIALVFGVGLLALTVRRLRSRSGPVTN